MNRFFALAGALAVASSAHAQLSITEVFVGLPGPDGTEDWFELTNVGIDPIDTGAFFYDDVSADILDAGQLDSFLLNPGESAVFLVTGNSDDLVPFNDIWGPVARVGLTNGGGGLSQDADTVNLLLGDGSVVDFLAYDDSLVSTEATMERLPGDATRISVLGENGAYESNPFFNDDIGQPPEFLVTLVGSPGVIPAPGSLALLGLAGLVAKRRTR